MQDQRTERTEAPAVDVRGKGTTRVTLEIVRIDGKSVTFANGSQTYTLFEGDYLDVTLAHGVVMD